MTIPGLGYYRDPNANILGQLPLANENAESVRMNVAEKICSEQESWIGVNEKEAAQVNHVVRLSQNVITIINKKINKHSSTTAFTGTSSLVFQKVCSFLRRWLLLAFI